MEGDEFEQLAGGVRGWAVLRSFRPRKTSRVVPDGGNSARRHRERARGTTLPLNRLFSSWQCLTPSGWLILQSEAEGKKTEEGNETEPVR
jgi:hypothetical protein